MAPDERAMNPIAAGRLRASRMLALCVLVTVSTLALGQPGATNAIVSSSAAPATTSLLDSVRNLLGSAKPAELLPPEQAFQLQVRSRDDDNLVATLTPATDYYLYRDRISFSLVDAPAGLEIEQVSLPPGKPKADPTFGTVQVFHGPVDALIRLRRDGDAPARISLRATYQGCNEPLGVCYPPIDRTVTVALRGDGGAPGRADVAAPNNLPEATALDSSDDADAVHRLFTQSSRWALVAAFFGFGLLLSFTPCMLPMIPILSGIIVGQRREMSRRHAFGLSAIYVLAMAVTYALAGVAAGLAGTLLSAYLQNPWVLGGFALVFVLLALSMFGLYELQLPAGARQALAAAGRRIPGGRATHVFVIGVLSAIIVGPCVAAPLAGALLYIGQTHDVVLGGTALFAMAVGMGVPLLVVGTAAGSILPKAGPWMVTVQRVFGVLMLAVAVYMVSPLIPLLVQQLLWGALLIVPAIYLLALDPQRTDAPRRRSLFKGVGALALLLGAAVVAGALSGHREILQPLAALGGAVRPGAPPELQFDPVQSIADLDARLLASRGRPVMLDFWADWCVSCKEMDQITFRDERVQARLKEVVLLRADVTANSADDQALLRRFGLFGPPGIVLFDPQGAEVGLRIVGYQSPQRFLRSLDRAGIALTAP